MIINAEENVSVVVVTYFWKISDSINTVLHIRKVLNYQTEATEKKPAFNNCYKLYNLKKITWKKKFLFEYP